MTGCYAPSSSSCLCKSVNQFCYGSDSIHLQQQRRAQFIIIHSLNFGRVGYGQIISQDLIVELVSFCKLGLIIPIIFVKQIFHGKC